MELSADTSEECKETVTRRKLPPYRECIRQSVVIGQGCRVYLDVDSPTPQEIWLRVRGPEVTPLVVSLLDQLAIGTASRLQYGESLEEICEPWIWVKAEPCGSVVGDARIKMCSSLLDWIGRHLLVNYAGRDDLAHLPAMATTL